ncbi:PIG-L deacetylase family protein [Arenibaculum sp.]|uniref:PIG-L deacetylase family protein n=1 Tax=Arenibaculum sp. TaxID=2865862 RepID=UPI002E11CD03|nr:PIG-L family deacetylase [Arenibaculum sp.]
MEGAQEDRVVVVRPGFHLRGLAVTFLISRRPALVLDPPSAALFAAVDGEAGLDGLERRFPGARAALDAWHAAGIVEFVPRAAMRAMPGTGRPLVVVEPHMDDAALSVGGRLLNRRGSRRMIVLSLTRQSNVSCYWSLGRDFFDADRVTELRLAESRLAAALAGAEHVALPLADAPLRFRPAEDWSPGAFVRLHDALAAFLAFPPLPAEVGRAAALLADAVLSLDPAELWLPLGLGGHVDHRLTRDAGLAMLAAHRDRFADVPVLLYEDHPYGTYFPHQRAHVVAALTASGLRLVPDVEDVTGTFADKLRMVGVFASQFKVEAMEPNLRRRAVEAAGRPGRLAESGFRLDGLPAGPLPPASELAPDRDDLRRVRRRLGRFLAGRMARRRVAVIAGAAFGRWREGMEILLEAFPSAAIDVFVAAEFAWETEDWRHPRVRVTVVRQGGWGGVLLREALRPGTPTVVLRFAPFAPEIRWREQILKARLPPRARAAHRLLAALLPARPVVMVRHLGDLCGLLVEKLGPDYAPEGENRPSSASSSRSSAAGG